MLNAGCVSCHYNFLVGAAVEVLTANSQILPSVLVIRLHGTAVGRLEVLHIQGLYKDDPDML